jgi:hypothetical protein
MRASPAFLLKGEKRFSLSLNHDRAVYAYSKIIVRFFLWYDYPAKINSEREDIQ